MVPNLPYFMVQFDHKGEKGYGHVIEGGSGDHDDDDLGQSAKGNEFPRSGQLQYLSMAVITNIHAIQIFRGGDYWQSPPFGTASVAAS
jgi:hypothetical protein